MDLHPVTQALRETTTTAEKRTRAFGARLDPAKLRSKPKGDRIVPGLDLPAMQFKYGPERAHWPRLLESCFRVPKDISLAAYFELRNQKILTAMRYWQGQGYELVNLSADEARWLARRGWKRATWLNGKPIQVIPGANPAFDLGESGEVRALPDQREFIVRANFRCIKPVTIREELDPGLVAPIEIKRSVSAA